MKTPYYYVIVIGVEWMVNYWHGPPSGWGSLLSVRHCIALSKHSFIGQKCGKMFGVFPQIFIFCFWLFSQGEGHKFVFVFVVFWLEVCIYYFCLHYFVFVCLIQFKFYSFSKIFFSFFLGVLFVFFCYQVLNSIYYA